MTRQDLYSQLVQILEAYLGPSADRFVRRHVESHLGKDVTHIDKKDIPELATWIKLSLSVISDDALVVARCERNVLDLAERKSSLSRE